MLRSVNLKSITHNLLKKQLSRILDKDPSKQLDELLSLIDEAYKEHDQERRLTERTMEVMSEELMEANQDLLKQTNELKIEKERYSLAAAAANDALWDWDLVNNTIFYSSRWREMLGISKDIDLHSIDDWYCRISSEYVPIFQDVIQKHLNGIYKRIELEFKMRTEQGNEIWVLVRGLASHDKNGKPIRIAGSQTDITLKKTQEAALYKAAYHDELTGLPNRTLFLDRLNQVIKRESRMGERPAAVLFVDLDRFKYINDTMGHEFGDEVLKEVAKVLESQVRSFDTISRLGGDEFTVLLDFVEDINEAMHIAQRLLKQLNRPFKIKNKEVYISSSIGLTMVENIRTTAHNILRNADLAMYEAKSTGKSRLEIFDTEHHQRLLNKMEIERELRKAIAKGRQFNVHYQPIVDLRTGEIDSFEALIRWFNPEKGYIPPAIFIPIAEEVGLVGQIGEEVLFTVCNQIESWSKIDLLKVSPRVSVNLSVRQLMDERYYKSILKKLQTYQYTNLITLEMTESVIMSNSNLVSNHLQDLKNLGVRLSIDDFGTGYSSLSYLHKYSYDKLKIDQSFIKLLNIDKKSEQLTAGIIGLAQDLNIETIAEGVETWPQVKKLQELGCNYAQGFYFSKALNSKAATLLLTNNKVFSVNRLSELEKVI